MVPPALLSIYPLNSVKVTVILLNDPYHPFSTWATIDLSSHKSLINRKLFSNAETADIAIQLTDDSYFILTARRDAIAERTVLFIRNTDEEFGHSEMHLMHGLLLGSKDMLRMAPYRALEAAGGWDKGVGYPGTGTGLLLEAGSYENPREEGDGDM